MSGHLSVVIDIRNSSSLETRCLIFRLQRCNPFEEKFKSRFLEVVSADMSAGLPLC